MSHRRIPRSLALGLLFVTFSVSVARAQEVARFTVHPDDFVGPPLVGFGAQFNPYLYASPNFAGGAGGNDKGDVTEENVRDLERKLLALRPQHVRIFFNSAWWDGGRDGIAKDDPRMKQSFLRTAHLAQRCGATINLTCWHGPWPQPREQAARFADIVKELRDRHDLASIRYVTLQNEPNLHNFDKDKLATIYRSFDEHARQIGLRDQVQLIGGDLVQNDQQQWFEHLAEHQPFLDGYAVHMYWDYWDTAKLQRRISEVPKIVAELPKPAHKPIYVTEFGVRGKRDPGVDDPGAYETADGPPLTETPLQGMQVAWFMMEAINRGYVATVQWDAYVASYGHEMRYGMIGGVKQGWPLRPAYHVLRMFTHTTQPGWRAVRVEGDAPEVLVAATRSSRAGDLTAYVLNRGDQPRRIGIAGIDRRRPLYRLTWNGSGDGTLAQPEKMMPPGDRVDLNVPAGAVTAVTTAAPE